MKKSFKAQLIVTGIAAIGVLAAYTSGIGSEGGNLAPPPADSGVYPQVSTFQPSAANYASSIKGYGEVLPVRNLSLAAEISGRIIEISPAFKSGERLNTGDVLIKIDDTAYREAVASAESNLAAAEVTLLQQQLNQSQARAEWQRSGLTGSPDSGLALYEPQVKAAEAAVLYAQRALEKARSDLRKTVIRAPFNALVVSRSAEVGGIVQSGSELARLYGTDQVEVTLAISTRDWRNLPPQPDTDKSWMVTLSDTESDFQWQGYVDRIEQHIETNTRQRSMIVRLDNPLDHSPPLYPGTFIEAAIPGITLQNVWQVPASSLTQNGEIWYIDSSNMLRKTPARLRLRMADSAYLEPDPEIQNPLLVKLPLASYLPGMVVTPMTATESQNSLSQIDNAAGTSQ